MPSRRTANKEKRKEKRRACCCLSMRKLGKFLLCLFFRASWPCRRRHHPFSLSLFFPLLVPAPSAGSRQHKGPKKGRWFSCSVRAIWRALFWTQFASFRKQKKKIRCPLPASMITKGCRRWRQSSFVLSLPFFFGLDSLARKRTAPVSSSSGAGASRHGRIKSAVLTGHQSSQSKTLTRNGALDKKARVACAKSQRQRDWLKLLFFTKKKKGAPFWFVLLVCLLFPLL